MITTLERKYKKKFQYGDKSPFAEYTLRVKVNGDPLTEENFGTINRAMARIAKIINSLKS